MKCHAAIRRVLGWPEMPISKDAALSIARELLGRELACPLEVSERLTGFCVRTGLGRRPAGPWFDIDGYSGNIRRWGLSSITCTSDQTSCSAKT
jgi:hypothetical protein